MIAPLLLLVGIFAGVGGIFLARGDDSRPSSSATDNAPDVTPATPDSPIAPDGVYRAITPETLQNALEAIANESRSSEPQAREQPVRARPRRPRQPLPYEWVD